MMSIRLRLSLLYTAILVITLSIFGVILYTVQHQYTLSSIRRELFTSGQNLSHNILWRYLHPPPFEDEKQPPPLPLQSLSGEQAFQALREREIVRVLDASGTLIASPLSGAQAALPLSKQGYQALNSGQVWWEIAVSDGERMLILNHPVSADGQLLFIVQTARTLTERDRSLSVLRSALLITSVVISVGAFGIGWVLAGITLRPIQHITQTAQAIGNESDLTRRVDYKGPNDEVGQLARTFNSMLARLQDAYERVRHALKMQRDFVADASHELRTPLTTVRGNLELLKRDPPLPAEEKSDILNDLIDESDRLIRLVNDLLVLARADAGRNLACKPVALFPLIEEACRQMRQVSPQRQILVMAQTETGSPVEIENPDLTVFGDRDALKQVFLILLDNALKYSQGEIQVQVREYEKKVMVSIHDQGPGIPPDVLEHVFDRFYRGEIVRATPGFGLGLPIAKALVEAMGGTIALESQVGKGSVVWVHLNKT